VSGIERQFRRKTRREARRHALVLARAQGCACNPTVTWHSIVGRPGEAIHLAHASHCPRLHELRRLRGEERLSASVVTGGLR
jgi:hypothetical protein